MKKCKMKEEFRKLRRRVKRLENKVKDLEENVYEVEEFNMVSDPTFENTTDTSLGKNCLQPYTWFAMAIVGITVGFLGWALWTQYNSNIFRQVQEKDYVQEWFYKDIGEIDYLENVNYTIPKEKNEKNLENLKRWVKGDKSINTDTLTGENPTCRIVVLHSKNGGKDLMSFCDRGEEETGTQYHVFNKNLKDWVTFTYPSNWVEELIGIKEVLDKQFTNEKFGLDKWVQFTYKGNLYTYVPWSMLDQLDSVYSPLNRHN